MNKKPLLIAAPLFFGFLALATAGRASDRVPPQSAFPHKQILSVRASGVPGIGGYQGTVSVAYDKKSRNLIIGMVYCDTLSQTSCSFYSNTELVKGIEPITVPGVGSLLYIRAPKFGKDAKSDVTVDFKGNRGGWRTIQLQVSQVSGASPFKVKLEEGGRLTEFNQLGLRIAIFPHIGMKTVSFGLNDRAVANFSPEQFEEMKSETPGE